MGWRVKRRRVGWLVGLSVSVVLADAEFENASTQLTHSQHAHIQRVIQFIVARDHAFDPRFESRIWR